MALAKVLLLLYIPVSVGIFLWVSRLNRSFLNSFTVSTASTILIRLIPFAMAIESYADRRDACYVLILILYISAVFRFLSYCLFRQAALPLPRISPQQYAASRYPGYLLLSVAILTAAFVLLGVRGVGVSTWIFNTRYAYLVGRKGNGVWYILFELFLMIGAVFYLCGMKSRQLWKYIPFAVFMLGAYFTGSKGFILGMALIFLFYYDRAIRPIPVWAIALAGLGGLAAVVVLLRFQSNISLMEYSDYYAQFLRFVQYNLEGKWEYTMGRLSAEQRLWILVPRALYPDKPFSYGETRIVELFYGLQTIVAGNTPSFSEFILPYADFGLAGVAFSAVKAGMVGGLVEKYLSDCMQRDGVSFNAFFLYAMLLITRPVNFSNLYLAVFFAALLVLQKVKLSDGGHSLFPKESRRQKLPE